MNSNDGFTLELTELETLPGLTEAGTCDRFELAVRSAGDFVVPCNTYDPAALEDATERALEIMSIAYPVFLFGHTPFRSSVN